MTISFRGAIGLGSGTSTAVTWTLPGNVAANDFLLAAYSGKPFNATFGATSPPQTYTALGSATNGTVANGVGVGSNHTIGYWKVHGASEGATMAGTLGVSPSPSMAAVVGFRSSRGGTAWTVQTTVGQDVDATGTTFSALGSAALTFYPGQLLVVIVGTPDDVNATSSWSVTASGITFGTASQTLGTVNTATGNDGSLDVITFPVTAGTGAVTPTFTMTTSNNDSNGAATFVLITEPQTVTGTVTGAASTSGTIFGGKGRSGTVTGSATTSGTVVGTKAEGGNNKTGTVTGSATTSGTAAGAKGAIGSATGSATTSGTITGAEGDTGAVTGSATTSGTVTGSKAGYGTATGTASTTGTATGTAARFGTVTGQAQTSGSIGGVPPTPVTPDVVGGLSTYRRQQIVAAQLAYARQAQQQADTRGGTVAGACTTSGRITGRPGRAGRTLPTTTLTRRTVTTGVKAITTRTHGTTETRARVRGDAVYPMSAREVRRLRDDAELLLII